MAEARRSSRALIVVAAVAALVTIGLAIAGAVLQPSAPLATERPTPSVLADPTTAPTLAPSRIPGDCARIYTRDWASEVAPFVLNPEWTRGDTSVGTTDDALEALLAPNVRLSCRWVAEAGPSDTGVLTSLAQLDAQTADRVRTRFNQLGWTCFDFAGGVRCITEGHDDNGRWGESHFLRDNIWIATRWTNLAPDGYTADIVHTLWP